MSTTERHPVFYEPWLPQPGDLVRVKVGAECRVTHLCETDPLMERIFGKSSFAEQPCRPSWADGQTGTVISVSRYPAPDDDGSDVDDGHDFYVNDCGDCGHRHYLDDFFAAIELELIQRPAEVVS